MLLFCVFWCNGVNVNEVELVVRKSTYIAKPTVDGSVGGSAGGSGDSIEGCLKTVFKRDSVLVWVFMSAQGSEHVSDGPDQTGVSGALQRTVPPNPQ